MRTRIAVIGAGVSGLSAAYRLHQLVPNAQISLLEASGRLGGVIRTERRDGALIEKAADNFIKMPPHAVNLCRELGLEDQLVPTRRKEQGALVVRRQRLLPIPDGFAVMAPAKVWPFLTSPILNPWGKLRAAGEIFIPAASADEDESLQDFVVRRFGQQMFDRLVQPLVGSIYTADPTRLSVAATLSRFKEMEQQHGSLIRGTWKQKAQMQKSQVQKAPAKQTSSNQPAGGARYGLFATLKQGMGQLIDALSEQLTTITVRLNSPLDELLPSESGGWRLRVGGSQPAELAADAVILAAPAPATANFLDSFSPETARQLRSVHYASCGLVHLLFRREQIAHPLNAFGLVVPLKENRNILSCSFSSEKYPGRAPRGTVLVRAYLGGACQAELLDRSDDELGKLARTELASLLGARGEPLAEFVTRQERVMPQYHVGHLQRVKRIESELQPYPTLAFAGSSLDGVGVPACVHSGRQAAEQIVNVLGQQPAADLVRNAV